MAVRTELRLEICAALRSAGVRARSQRDRRDSSLCDPTGKEALGRAAAAGALQSLIRSRFTRDNASPELQLSKSAYCFHL